MIYICTYTVAHVSDRGGAGGYSKFTFCASNLRSKTPTETRNMSYTIRLSKETMVREKKEPKIITNMLYDKFNTFKSLCDNSRFATKLKL